MSIYNTELVRANYDIYAVVTVQDDFTGGLRTALRQIHNTKGVYWFSADGRKVDVTTLREDFIRREDQIRDALKWYKETKWIK